MSKKNKSKYQVFAKDGQHEYDITVKETKDGKKFSLRLSNGDQWQDHAKGQLELTMLDTGDDIVFNPPLETIDYAMLTNVRLLMGLERKLDDNKLNREKYKLVGGKKVIKL